MPRCNRCGQAIQWTKTQAGKKIPVDPGEVAVVEDYHGPVFAIWPDGAIARARFVSESYEDGYDYCRISHFSTCKGAKR